MLEQLMVGIFSFDISVPHSYIAIGTIVIFTGILPIARDEQGLAAIIGHG
jgi:hypothetical protein